MPVAEVLIGVAAPLVEEFGWDRPGYDPSLRGRRPLLPRSARPRPICYKAACVLGSQPQPRSIMARRTFHRPKHAATTRISRYGHKSISCPLVSWSGLQTPSSNGRFGSASDLWPSVNYRPRAASRIIVHRSPVETLSSRRSEAPFMRRRRSAKWPMWCSF